jgi:hypothetical protein
LYYCLNNSAVICFFFVWKWDEINVTKTKKNKLIVDYNNIHFLHTHKQKLIFYTKHICVGTSYTTITIEVQNIRTVDYSLHFITEIHSRYPCTNHGGTKSNEKWMKMTTYAPAQFVLISSPLPPYPCMSSHSLQAPMSPRNYHTGKATSSKMHRQTMRFQSS